MQSQQTRALYHGGKAHWLSFCYSEGVETPPPYFKSSLALPFSLQCVLFGVLEVSGA